MTFLFQCDNCGFEEELDKLAKTVIGYKFHNNIWDTRILYPIIEDTYEAEYNGEDDFRSWESYHIICPKCGHKEEWVFEEGTTYPYAHLRWSRRRGSYRLRR